MVYSRVHEGMPFIKIQGSPNGAEEPLEVCGTPLWNGG